MKIAEDLGPLMDPHGNIDWAITQYPQHAEELARHSGEDYEVVIVGGGDGTVHGVVNGLMDIPAEKRPTLGILPLGSSNDFSYSMGIPADPQKAFEHILMGNVVSIDVGYLEIKETHQADIISEYWINTLGIGFDAVVLTLYNRISFTSGFIAFLMAVLQTIMLYHEAPILKVKTDLYEWEQSMLMFIVCNGSREGGGFLVAPDACPEDGKLNFAWVEDVGRLMMLRLLPHVIKGTHGRFRQVRLGECTHLHLVADRPLNIHTDGELITGSDLDVRSLEIKLIPNAIRFFG